MKWIKKFRALADETLACWIRPESLILRQWEGTGKSSPRLCLFAHFDPEHRIDPYVVFYIKKLAEAGCEIHFITTSEKLTQKESESIHSYCKRIIVRKNYGIDFGSWKVGLHTIPELSNPQQTRYQQLILANDSVYGPLEFSTQAFPQFLESMNSRDLDFWGITSSREIAPHIQSYFMSFSHRAISSDAFHNFWNHFKFYRSKYRSIDRYELRLSSLGESAGWKIGVWIDPKVLSHPDLNSTLFEWPRIISEFQCPFLKTETLKLDRGQIPEAKTWQAFLRKNTHYPTELIRNHLSRVKPANPLNNPTEFATSDKNTSL